MTNEQKREIRSLLLGKTQLAEDGILVALRPGEFGILNGVGDGAGAVRFLGIGRRTQLLSSKVPEARTLEIGWEIMKDIGRRVYLQETPEAACCLIRYILTRPALLILQYIDGKPVLTAWAGRGATAWISRRRAIKAFLKRMPKQLTAAQGEAPVDELEKKPKKEKKTKKGKKAGGSRRNQETENDEQGGNANESAH